MNERSILSRGFLILNAFSVGRHQLTLTNIAERTGLPKATVHRLASQLVELGALERSDDKYQLGIRMFELGGRVSVQAQLREVASPFLQSLFEATQETVHLAILDGSSVVYVERISGHRRCPVPTRSGGRMPAYSTGLGKALLAFAPPHLLEETVAGKLVTLTRHTITVPHILLEQLKQVKATGIAYDREESRLGVGCVASPIKRADGSVTAAVSVTGPTVRILGRGLESAVRRATLGIARQLDSWTAA